MNAYFIILIYCVLMYLFLSV